MMLNQYTKARFWKCALQVNGADYIKVRGASHGLSEDEYNLKLVQVAIDNDVKVIGLADHGNVDQIDAIRQLMNKNDILVFPGFEIASSEKVHFVCLFAEDITRDDLIGFLSKLEVDRQNPTDPSKLSADKILKKVNELEGFIYAAHCTGDNGILTKKLGHIWKSPLLKAVQIPATVESLKSIEGDFYRKVILNKNNDYQREDHITVINAKDVATPDDIANAKASCLIKMTQPSFNAFKLAFQDPKSRVRLNSDISEKYYSRIESLTVIGGYLDGLKIDFSEHLNSIIGGRGTGKSTLLECIRWVLELEPIGQNAKKQHTEIIKENFGKSRARVEMVIQSAKMNGKSFTIARKYPDSASVKDQDGNISSFSPHDLLPEIEIYGHNEISEIAQDRKSQRRLLKRFLGSDHGDNESKIKEIIEAMIDNRKKIIEALNSMAITEDELAKLPKLEEQVEQFKLLGLEEKLKIIPLLENEKRLHNRVTNEELLSIDEALQALHDALPDTVFLSDKALERLPHAEIFCKIRAELDQIKVESASLTNQLQVKVSTSKGAILGFINTLKSSIKLEEDKLDDVFKVLPSSEGKSGREIGVEFQALLKSIEKIKPKKVTADNQNKLVHELELKRKGFLAELSEQRSIRSAKYEDALKILNRKLHGKLRLTVKPESNRTVAIEFLLNANLEGVGEKRLAWIKDAEDFSPVKLAELIKSGAEALSASTWGIPASTANSLVKLANFKVLQLEELELQDDIHIELNVAHKDRENFRLLEKLSTGQKCTAILHLLLLQNKDPLIMDQPEDNLDNAFIADRIVAELRAAKISRQFMFATHNANIPVFGDAEWIGVFEEEDGKACMPPQSQGAIDITQVRDKAANILEGGKTAFNQRKAKYGF
jgi:ABC-type lipoprotein export system ATPase subunit